MNDERKRDVALFRLAVLGNLVHTQLQRGDLRRALEQRAGERWVFPDGRTRRLAAKTIQSWLYAYRRHGFDGLIPQDRKDHGHSRSIPPRLQALILEMKREDPGRSTPLILRELQNVGLMRRGDFSAASVNRLLGRHGLSGPKMELQVAARHRFVAATCGELWQGDACHGPKLPDGESGRETRVKIFGLLDDKSRLITYLRASFHERQEDFLRVLFEAVRRRGVPRSLLLDNHGSFSGADARVTCARLGIRLVHARPHDGASKGKIERFWRTLRGHVLDRLDPDAVRSIDELNLRLMTWVDGEYNLRPHSGLGGRAPLDVFEEDAGEIRFVQDSDELEASFTASVERAVKNDSTCTVGGRVYEVPPHLRGRTVRLHYQVLRPGVLWLEEGSARVPVRPVDAVANSRRPRTLRTPPPQRPRPTGLNAVEDSLKKLLHPDPVAEAGQRDCGTDAGDDREGGAPCAR